MVCDMSSDIFSRQLDFSRFDLIYAGAQKNMGPAGTTLVVVKNDLLGKVSRKIPSMLNYQVHIDKDSMFNTPSVFAVYVSMLTLQWLKDMGGISAIEEINEKKAKLIYSEIDLNPLFKGFAKSEDRSNMNATFTLTDEAIRQYDTNTKVSPPLRTAQDVEAVKAGLRDGSIDVIASDHAAHEKQGTGRRASFSRRPFQ